MRKLIVGSLTAALLLIAGPASAAVVNANNLVHVNNTLRCSGQCDIVSDNVLDVDVLP